MDDYPGLVLERDPEAFAELLFDEGVVALRRADAEGVEDTAVERSPLPVLALRRSIRARGPSWDGRYLPPRGGGSSETSRSDTVSSSSM